MVEAGRREPVSRREVFYLGEEAGPAQHGHGRITGAPQLRGKGCLTVGKHRESRNVGLCSG
jgi:hypothetical protein